MNLIAAAPQNQVADGLAEILNYPMTPEISEDLRTQIQIEIISGRLFWWIISNNVYFEYYYDWHIMNFVETFLIIFV